MLALPGDNLIFAATPTERITHYTLQAKSCAKGQAPLETQDNKIGRISRTFPVLDVQSLFVVSSLRRLCEYKEIEIIEANACKDHIHMLVSIPPKTSVSSFVGYLKGKSSLMI